MKKLTLGLLLVFLIGFSAGATLKDFSYIKGSGSGFNLNGGETLFMGANFTNTAENNVPLGVEVYIDGKNHDMNRSDREFDITGYLDSGTQNLVRTSYDNSSDGEGVYRFRLNDSKGLSPGNHSLELEIKSNPGIRPDTYSFDFSIKSTVGFGESKNVSISPGRPEVVNFESGSVNLSSENSRPVNLEVKKLSDVTVSPPEHRYSNFVGGFSVKKASDDVDLSGTVTISYNEEALDSRNMNLYRFTESGNAGGWKKVESTHYTSNNSVIAHVDHFSTYAVYANSTGDEKPRAMFTSGFTSSQREKLNNTNKTQKQDQQSQNKEKKQGKSKGPQNGTSSRAPGESTGLFTANPSGNVTGLIVLFFAAMSVLEYTDTTNFIDRLEKMP